jgi:hypothetical protein
VNHRRPTVAATVEVSEDEAEAYSPTASFQNMVFRPVVQRVVDVGAVDATLSPLHLGELPFGSALPGYLS